MDRMLLTYFDYLKIQALYIQYKVALQSLCAAEGAATGIPLLLPVLPDGAAADEELAGLFAGIAVANQQVLAFAALLRVCVAEGRLEAAQLYCREAHLVIDGINDRISEARSRTAQHATDHPDTQGLAVVYESLLLQDQQLRAVSQKAEDTQRAADRHEQRFNNIIMQAPVGITILRAPDLLIEFANEAYLQIVDKKAADFVGKGLFEALPEVQAAVQPILKGVLTTGEPYFGNEFEVPLNRFGHVETTYFNFVYQPLYTASGAVSGVMVIANDITQQVGAKLALIQSENHFRDLVLQSPVAMTIFKGPDWVIDIANESLLKYIWRRQLHEVQGKRLMDVFPELKGQRFPALLQQVYTSGERYSEREAVAFVDGPDGYNRYYLDFEYAPLRTPDGAVSGIMVTVNNVTEMIEAREQIKYAAERLSLATDGTKLATWDINLVTQEVIYSPRLAVIFGYPESRILTHTALREHIHPDDRTQIVEKAFELALKTGIYQYEARLIHPDHSVHWVRTQGKVIFNEAREPVRMLGTMMDISEQKRAEQVIRESERKFRTLADSMPQHVWTADPEGRLTYFNDTVCRYTGLSPEELQADSWQSIIHPDDRQATLHSWLDAVRHGHDFLFEHRFRREDGCYRWQLSRAVPQRDEEGSIQMWVGTSTDIHDHKLFSDELELKVRQRTEELVLLNEQLVQSNAELEQFAYVASHDLQEPLRKIQTFATRIAELDAAQLSDRGKDYFNRMQSASKRMQQLIHDVLSFSRINKGEQGFTPTDLNLLLDSVLEQLHELIEQTGTEVHADRLPVLTVIPYQLDQLFTNLITNSIKFSRAGLRSRIDIRYALLPAGSLHLAAADPSKAYHCIRFRDNGIGFESSFRERIFQVFQRLHGRKDYEGTGIGLAICKKIMDNHAGFIIAESEPDMGAEFSLFLPEER